MSPHYRATRVGNKTTVPPEYLPADYVAPEFGVNVNVVKDSNATSRMGSTHVVID